jgi:hypothetical protein
MTSVSRISYRAHVPERKDLVKVEIILSLGARCLPNNPRF